MVVKPPLAVAKEQLRDVVAVLVDFDGGNETIHNSHTGIYQKIVLPDDGRLPWFQKLDEDAPELEPEPEPEPETEPETEPQKPDVKKAPLFLYYNACDNDKWNSGGWYVGNEVVKSDKTIVGGSQIFSVPAPNGRLPEGENEWDCQSGRRKVTITLLRSAEEVAQQREWLRKAS